MPLCFIQIFGSRSVSFTVAVSVAVRLVLRLPYR